jgi:hypothetical protein
MGSVCSLIAYTRSWVSEQPTVGIGAEQTAIWQEGLRRAMNFREEMGDDRFADVSFQVLNTDPVGTVSACFEKLGVPFEDASRAAVTTWASAHRPGQEGTHDFALGEFDLTADGVRRDFDFYLERFGDQATMRPPS